MTVELADPSFVYDCDSSRLPQRLADRFVQLDLDEGARRFVADAQRLRHGRWVSLAHGVLRGFLSDFDVNGLLGTYPMRLLSTEQWRQLLGEAARGSLLDVGAGNGDVTATLAPCFSRVTTTETSRPMVRRLRRRGYECHRLDLSRDPPPEGAWDVVSCLNVLDRSEQPRSLLRSLRALVSPGGRIVLATPLPYDPFVYDGGRTLPPLERLAVDAEQWEDALTELVTAELEPLGLALEVFTRAPYLSGGDPRRALYVLDDAVLVCRSA